MSTRHPLVPPPDVLDFGFVTPQHWQSWDEILELWQFAEETGWDSAWLMDHFFSMADGELGDCLEAWTLLAGLLAHVPRLNAGVFVSGITHRSPMVLYKQAATVDRLSGGRLILGLGAAWNAREHAAHGLEFPPPGERVARFGEALELLRLLEVQERTTYAGGYYQVDEVPFAPKPVHGRFPVMIGAKGRKMLRHVARYADIWEGSATPDGIAELSAVVAAECRAIGRDPSEIRLLVEATGTVHGDPFVSEDVFRRHVTTYAEVGVRSFLFNIPRGPITPTMRAISERVIPELRAGYATIGACGHL
jgi:alkanesulfonate monooxygenase SsuD/methylene tetrahydromethanopterin reductase-like flavin-dependent oxidoreductase (luciferase family)